MTIDHIRDTNIFIGNSNDARDIDHLRILGIKSVLNVANDLEDPWFHGDFRNYKVSLRDGEGNQLYQYVLALQVLLTLLSRGEKVLLHCGAGVSRSPGIAAAALVLRGKAKDLEEGIKKIAVDRQHIHVSHHHLPLLREAIKQLAGAP